MPAEEKEWTGSMICDVCWRDVRSVGQTFVVGQLVFGPAEAVICAPDYSRYGAGTTQRYHSTTRRPV